MHDKWDFLICMLTPRRSKSFWTAYYSLVRVLATERAGSVPGTPLSPPKALRTEAPLRPPPRAGEPGPSEAGPPGEAGRGRAGQGQRHAQGQAQGQSAPGPGCSRAGGGCGRCLRAGRVPPAPAPARGSSAGPARPGPAPARRAPRLGAFWAAGKLFCAPGTGGEVKH